MKGIKDIIAESLILCLLFEITTSELILQSDVEVCPSQKQLVSCECRCEETAQGVWSFCCNQRLTALCNDCRGNITRLDLTDNLLSCLDVSQTLALPNLRRLDLSRNKVSVISATAVHRNLTILNLTANLLANVSVRNFPFPNLEVLKLTGNRIHKADFSFDPDADQNIFGLENLQILRLDGNSLVTVHNSSFSSLLRLKYLDLQHNKLLYLQPQAFQRLTLLESLKISYNDLFLNSTSYPAGVFEPLKNLRNLSMHSCREYLTDRDICYPDIFNPLTRLQRLTIDTCVVLNFDRNFSKLLNVTRLETGKNCLAQELRENALIGFHNHSLEELYLDTCPIQKLHHSAFRFLPNLKVLSLRRTAHFLWLRPLFKSLSVLQHQNMSLLDFNYVSVHRCPALKTKLQHVKPSTVPLSKLCVTELIMRDNSLNYIFPHDPLFQNGTRFSSCIQRVDLSRNQLLDMFKMKTLSVFLSWTRVEHLSLECQNTGKAEGDDACRKPTRSKKGEVTENEGEKGFQQLKTGPSVSSSLPGKISSPGTGDVQHFPLPPSLRVLNLSYTHDLMNIFHRHVHFGGNLSVLDLAHNDMSDLSGSMKGLDWLQELHLSGNMQTATTSLLANLTRLRDLHLGDASVTASWLQSQGCAILGSLKTLQLLDVSHNALPSFPPLLLECLPALNKLDLRYNNMTTLSFELRQRVDSLHFSRNLTIHLSGNPWSCMCDNIGFLTWLSRTESRLDQNGNYPCIGPDGATTTGEITKNLDYHWRRCIGANALLAAGIMLSVLLMLVVCVLVASWNATYLRYLVRTIGRIRLPQRKDFRKDVYVGYADGDWRFACLTIPQCLEQRRGVRVLQRHEEEVPGSVRAENIMQHMDESWRVLLVVSNNTLEDEWFAFTVLAAQQSISDCLPHRVLLLILDLPVPPLASLSSLLPIVPESHVLHIPRDTPPQHELWDRLARLILQE